LKIAKKKVKKRGVEEMTWETDMPKAEAATAPPDMSDICAHRLEVKNSPKRRIEKYFNTQPTNVISINHSSRATSKQKTLQQNKQKLPVHNSWGARFRASKT
jgi:hypothetical protein